MTHALVQQAIQTLQASGQPISVRKVNRVMRATPPYFGMSFRDLLPWLRHPHVTGKECYGQVLEIIDAIEAARRHSRETLPALLVQGENVWRTCVPRLQAVTVSVDGPTARLLWPHVVRQLKAVLASTTVTVRG
jgi:hypothetical protein